MNNDNKIIAMQQYKELLSEKIKSMQESDFTSPWFPSIIQPQNINGRKYKNCNNIILSLQCERKGYQTGVFLTHKQIKEDKISIKKGERCTYISYKDISYLSPAGNLVTLKEYNNLDQSVKSQYTRQSVLKYYAVFNIEQTNFPEKHPEAWNTFIEQYSAERNSQGKEYVNPALDKIIRDNSWECNIETTIDTESIYSWNDDKILLRPLEQCSNKIDFYSSALHGMSESTGHPTRLARSFNEIGDERYTGQAFVSELSAAYIGKELDMSILPSRNAGKFAEKWIKAIELEPFYIYDIIGDIKRTSALMESHTSKAVNDLNPAVKVDTPQITSFRKETYDNIVYAIGYRSDGSPFKSPVYHRGEEYCFTTGSIIDGDLTTHYLSKEQIVTVEDLKDYKINTRQSTEQPITISTSRKSITYTSDSATIRYANKDYPASPILETLKSNNINPKDITAEQWKSLLKGQGLKLGDKKQGIFSIIKTPSGYGMRVANVIKKITTENYKS